jgi:CHAD domain-containing protein
MPRFNKWIADTHPEQPVSEAARRALEARLEAVWHYLSAAARHRPAEAENVHQLRVWSRRAGAALRVFEELLPRRRARWFRKQVRRARRTAGELRDLDVLAQRLRQRADRGDGGDLSAALARIDGQRSRCGEPLEELHHRLKRKRYLRRLGGLLGRVAYRGDSREPDFASVAREHLRQRAAELFVAAEGNLSDVAALHALRIAGKRLRYSMEVFAGAFGAAFREVLYPRVEALQERLGEVNDHATAVERWQRWRGQAADAEEAAQFGRLLSAERQALARSRQSFLDWWSGEEAAALRQQLAAELGLPPDQVTVPVLHAPSTKEAG